MKKTTFTLALFLLTTAALFQSGCKKDEPETDPCENMTVNTMEATIDGTKWCANLTLTADMTIQLTISGINQSAWSLTLELDDVEPGTYQMAENTNYALLTVGGMIYEATNADQGTLTIIENNTVTNRARGTFSCKLYSPFGGSKNVTNGSFDVAYTN